MRLINYILAAFFLITASIPALAQDFEGTIVLKESHRNNEILKRITVKGEKVKVETFGTSDTTDLKGVQLIDLKSGKVTALLPARKLYFVIPNKGGNRIVNAVVKNSGATSTITVISGSDKKTYPCKDILVVSDEKKIKITYSMTEGNFSFYAKMLDTMNKNEVMSDFFGKITDQFAGGLPLKAVQQRMDGTVVESFEVVEITNRPVQDSAFEIPSDYSIMER